MKKVTSLLLLVGVAAFGLVGCGEDVTVSPEPDITGVSVTPSTLNIAVGETAPLSADVDGDPDNSVSWSSNNSAVATVDANGNVTGVAEGTAGITATSTVDNSQSASATVNVTALEKAEVSIAGWRSVDLGGGVFDESSPTVVGTRAPGARTRLIVTANIDEGDATLTTVELLLNGEVAATQDFGSASKTDREQAELEAQTGTSTVELAVDSDEFEGDPVGDPIVGSWPNGDYTVAVRINTQAGATDRAEISETIEFANENFFLVEFLEGNTAVNQTTGTRWWGGTDVVFGATPIIFDDLMVSQFTIDNTSAIDIGGGAGADITLTEAPFTFTAAADDNFGIEDASANFDVDDVRDDEGEDVDGLFFDDDITVPLDFNPPDVDVGGASEITEDGSDIMADVFYNAGVFGVSNIGETGVGGTNMTFHADLISTTDVTPDYEDVSSFADLNEHGDAATPATPSDVKVILAALEDDLGNATDLDATPVDASGADGGAPDAEDNASEFVGVDQTPVAYSDVLPAEDGLWLNPVDQDGDGTDNDLAFTAEDQTLADGNAPSGYAATTVSAEDSDGNVVALAAAPDASGANTIDIGALGDESWTVTATTTDNAVAANEAELVYTFMTDATPPTTNMTNPPASSVNSSNSTLTFTINGSASDAGAGLESVIVTVRDATSADGADPTACELDDTLLAVGSDPGEVDQNEVDVTDSADGFSVNFTINNAGSGVTQEVCFFIESTDAAVDVNGDNEGNTSDQRTKTDISWN